MIKELFLAASIIVIAAVAGNAQETNGKPEKGGRAQDKTAQDKQKNPDSAQGKKGNRRFREMDKNGDGYIQQAEWTGNKNGFARFDLNKDGQISLDEFNEARNQSGRSGGGRGSNPK